MALIQCAGCGAIATDKSGVCSQCGASLTRERKLSGKPAELIVEKEGGPGKATALADLPPPPKEKPYLDMFAEVESAGDTPESPKPKSSLVACQHYDDWVARDAKATPTSPARVLLTIVIVVIGCTIFSVAQWQWTLYSMMKEETESLDERNAVAVKKRDDLDRYKNYTIWNVERL